MKLTTIWLAEPNWLKIAEIEPLPDEGILTTALAMVSKKSPVEVMHDDGCNIVLIRLPEGIRVSGATKGDDGRFYLSVHKSLLTPVD